MVSLRTVVVVSAVLLLVTIPVNYIYFLHFSENPSLFEHSTLLNSKSSQSSSSLRTTTTANNHEIGRVEELKRLVELQAKRIQELEVHTEDHKSSQSKAQVQTVSKPLEVKSKSKSKSEKSPPQAPAFFEPSALARLDELHEEFDNRILEQQSPEDCSSAKYFVCPTTKATCGFGCFMHRTSWCFTRAIEAKSVMVLDPPIVTRYGRQCDPDFYTRNKGGRYTCYFQPVSTCQDYYDAHKDSVKKKYMSYSGKWSKKHIEYLPPYLEDLRELNPRYYNAWYLGHIVKYLMRPSPRLQQVYEASRYNTPFDFGIHVRRTDKLKSEALRYSLNEYMMHVDMFTHPERIYHGHYDEKYGKSVYVATDDATVMKDFKRFPQYEMNMNLDVAQQAGKATGSYSDGLEGVLLDLNALTKAKYFIGTMSSQLSRLVLELNYGNGIHDFHTRVKSLDEDYYCAK